jgi:hypothetical protein
MGWLLRGFSKSSEALRPEADQDGVGFEESGALGSKGHFRSLYRVDWIVGGFDDDENDANQQVVTS